MNKTRMDKVMEFCMPILAICLTVMVILVTSGMIFTFYRDFSR